MKSVSIRTLGEFIALVGVIFSLIFVGLEVRQNRISSRATAFQEIGIATADIWLSVASDVELNQLLFGIRSENDYFELSRTDQDRVNSFLIGALRLFETVHLQVQEGLLDSDALKSLGYEQFGENAVALRAAWPEIRVWVTPSFADYLADSGYVPD